MTTSQEIRDKHKQYLFPSCVNYYQEPVVVVEGNGRTVRDLDGREYLDFFGGILTVSVGHAHPKVTTAIIAQVQRLTHISTLYPTVPLVELAETLARITPGRLQKTYFTASGTEANETAVNMAQVFTGSQELIALRHSYSGRSLLAQTLTGNGAYRSMPSQVGAVKHALAPYCYRCPLKLEPKSCGTACAADIEELIRTTTTGRIAGMIVEPLLGVGGFITPPDDYFRIASEIVRKYGGVMIVDEVQTGFGRTGKLFAGEHYDLQPDIMTMAKGIANGMPLGATVCLPEIADAFKNATISTFGGNPVSTAAANATIAVIEEEQLVANSARVGAELMVGLKNLQQKHPKSIGEVRGKGLMIGLEIVNDETTRDRTPNTTMTLRIMEEAKNRGLLIGRGGLYGNVLRVAPSLSVTSSEAQEALERLKHALVAAGA